MKRSGLLPVAATVLAGVLLPSTALASGFEIGGRVGYAPAMGKLDDADDMSDFVSGQTFLWLDLGGRVGDSLFLGGYGSYGFGTIGSSLDDGCSLDAVDCSVSVKRLGFQVAYHFSPNAGTDPWLGLGLGYEWLSINLEADGQEASVGLSGLELPLLQGGLDFHVTDGFVLGPSLAFGIGSYSDAELCAEDECDNESLDSDQKASHQWLYLGLRAAIVP